MSAAYQQPASDAVYILVTLVLTLAGSLALYLDVGGVTTRLAEHASRQNRETALRYFQSRRHREWSTPENLLKMYRSMALATFALFCLVLIADVVALVVNGVR